MDYDGARVEGSAGDLRSVKQAEILERLATTIVSRLNADPATSYVAGLAAKGQDAILKKVAEEAAETLLASKDGDKLNLIRETADLWFHCMVLLAWHGLGPRDVLDELQRREGTSGIAEKKSRP
jgi:phosphoribosyl-ATP pyrophosphohydrolase